MKIKDFKKFFKYIKKNKMKMLLTLVFMVFSQSCAFAMPAMMANIIDIGIKRYGFDVGVDFSSFSNEMLISSQVSYMMKAGAQMILITLLSVMFSIISARFLSKISADISSDMRSEVYLTVLNMSVGDVDKLSVSSLITRATNDIEHVKSLILMSIHLLMPPFMALVGIYMALRTCAKMSWVIAFGTVASVVAVLVCLKLTLPKIKVSQLLNDRFNMIVRERLSGMVITRIFGNDGYELEKFNKCNAVFTDISFFINKVFAFTMPALSTVMNLIGVIIIWVGAHEIANTNMEVGDVMAFTQYSVLIVMSFFMFAMIIGNIPRAVISANRILEILNCKTQSSKNKMTISKNVSGNLVEFKDVYFRYGEAEEFAVKNINLSVKSGQKIGIIGPTGCGKSTVFKLLLGAYAPSSGNVFIDGVNIKNISQSDLSDLIGYVPQKPILFEGTVASNLRLGRNQIADETLFEALDMVQMTHLANAHGISEPVQIGGSNFSGGERQRLTLARAVVLSKKIYILDDSFSKLDFVTDKKLRERLLKKTQNSIIFIISQRIGTIKDCDKIILMDGGKIVAEGTHEQLLKSSEIYHNIARLQLGGGIE